MQFSQIIDSAGPKTVDAQDGWMYNKGWGFIFGMIFSLL